MKNGRTAVVFMALLGCAAALVRYPAEAAQAAREGLLLCAQSVIPSLFPFFILSSLAVSLGAAEALGRRLEGLMRTLFHVGGSGAAALALGLIGGYPAGARAIAELYRVQALNRTEAQRLLAFCNNAGPGFILGVIGGGVFQSSRVGVYLYLVHVCAALLTGLLFRRRSTAETGRRQTGEAPSLAQAFTEAVQSSFSAVLNVSSFVIFFLVALRLLEEGGLQGLFCRLFRGFFPAVSIAPEALFAAFWELTCGALRLQGDRGGFIAAAVFLGWGGLSVHAQTAAILAPAGLSTRTYFLGKAVQAALSLPLAALAAGWLF